MKRSKEKEFTGVEGELPRLRTPQNADLMAVNARKIVSLQLLVVNRLNHVPIVVAVAQTCAKFYSRDLFCL